MSTTQTYVYRIVDTGPHEDIQITLRKGAINLFTGRNGAGKTSATNAIIRASGGDAPVSVRRTGIDADGNPITVSHGTVEGPTANGSGVLIRVGGKVTKGETPSIGLTNYGTLHVIVTGDDQETPKGRDARRLDAILTANPIPVDAELLTVLTGGQPILSDTAAANLIKSGLSVRVVADQLKDAMNARALTLEEARDAHKGAADAARSRAARLPQPEAMDPLLTPLLDLDLDELKTQGEVAKSAADTARAGANRRAELELLRETLGDRPDPTSLGVQFASATQDRDDADVALHIASKELTELERLVALKRIEVVTLKGEANQKADMVAALYRRQADIELAAVRWDDNRAKFSAIDSLPTTTQADEADAAYQDARTQWARANQAQKAKAAAEAATKAINEATQEAAQADREYTAKLEEAKAWRTYAKGTSSRLGKVFSMRGIANMTIGDDGRLYHVETDADGVEVRRELFDDRSFGQKVSTMLEVAAGLGLFPLDPNFLFQLQPSKRRELAAKVHAAGAIVVSEWPTDDPEIGMLYFTGEEDDSAIMQAAPVSTAPMLTHSASLEPPARVEAPAAPKRKRPTLELTGGALLASSFIKPATPADDISL